MFQYFYWYNSVLQVIIESYQTSVKKKGSSSRTETSEILDHQNVSQWPSNRHKNHECCKSCLCSLWPWWLYVFLYFADYQIESRSVLIQCLHHVTSHSIVVTCYCIFVHKIYAGGKSNSYCLIIKINHRSFTSLCIGEHHGFVL